jgi:dolichol-phosphate mannosyltransferase
VRLSVVIPARDEAGNVERTVEAVVAALDGAGAAFEVVVVDDGSTDRTAAIVEALAAADPRVVLLRRCPPHGFGRAVRDGLAAARGDAMAIVMADGSDDPQDLVRYHALLSEGHACVFGTRFRGSARVSNYPRGRLVVNRAVNALVRTLFGHGHDDTTNAFKAYRREVVEDALPLLSTGFELTLELPLKAVLRGHRFATVDVSWRGRVTGRSKFRMTAGARYGLVVAWLLAERALRR